MPKRCEYEDSPDEPPSKRTRLPDRLSALSDELLLHVLSFLSIPSLITCQRVSQRFAALAGDSELWKRKYYSRWVWPRARRIRQIRQGSTVKGSLDYSPQVSNWFSHGPLTQVGEERNWKGQYRLQHNWSRGSCRVTEVEVAQRPVSPVVVKLEHGIVFTADIENGLRAWSIKDTKTCLATVPYSGIWSSDVGPGVPTAIAVTANNLKQGCFGVTVGFSNGGMVVYSFESLPDGGSTFELQLRHSDSAAEDAAITALASHKDFILAISEDNVLYLYQLYYDDSPLLNLGGNEKTKRKHSMRLIASLVANSIQSPFSLSVRTTSTHAIASVSYTFPRIGCGWSVGIQELYWSKDGGDLTSRLATTVDCQYLGNKLSEPAADTQVKRPRQMMSTPGSSDHRSPMAFPSLSYTQPPTSLSYSHPYLLASHADNTLTMYLVVSTTDSLSIKTGRRLWGHTSAVSGVQVSSRGKAVSVSTKGDEIRIWELEEMISSRAASKTALIGDRSVQLSPEPRRSRTNPFSVLSRAVKRQVAAMEGVKGISSEVTLSCIKGPVEFDDEQVVVLREHSLGTQLLGCYDFT
ncbi:WD domain-containing protein [Nannizzia gypsea CBS 118893]|uniref:Probable E3 ubiquitin ligase complex SCF subunit sconB n=1 Tax=Arthroderma gypseum (strain ATCC MYA-4604 / CBS 118893) TaxID=535722 RepID=E4UZ19_ARTGP|nr:WD domain-containing protein [Nannizzia gypsea CBS 118893]EFR03349.1 WD domain-containing protein [Nannizzia gypsea CBS 118893]